ncbi:MAG: rRNA maturation RNase YbeY [Parvibaculales bacterium]
MNQIHIEVQMENVSLEKIERERVENTICQTLALAGEKNNIGGKEVGVCVTDNGHIRKLNRKYRNKDKATNILAFPSDTPDYLGDLLISWEKIGEEAEVQKKKPCHHLAHIALHGLLHLIGFDHKQKSEAEKMERMEIAILGELGIENPYRDERIL